MSFREDKNCDGTSENMEQEDKVNVEEASVNLGYVKKELNEEELAFEDNQSKIALTFENVFGHRSTEQKNNRNSLIDFLDGDVVMKIETGTVKLEDVNEENKDLIQETIGQSYCNECGGNYQGYCLNCSSLSHILNNLVPNLNLEPVLNTTPTNTLEIREVSRRSAVFALKTLPKGIILGPFEGIAPIESTTGLQWKIKDKKFVNDENGNWMKHIQSVANHGSKNLDVFQFDGILYFETSREIQDGEELLVCYGIGEKQVVESDKQKEFYLVPVKKEEDPKVFACTLCCLGFRLERCLLEHKSKCRQACFEDFEIIQCHCCKVWLERQEYMESHIMYCFENYNRSCRSRNLPDFASTITADEEQVLENEEITTSIHVNASHSTLPIDSNNCVSRADFKVHKEGYFLDVNMGTTDSATKEKEYKCSACSYQTNRKGNLKIHLGTHTGIKDFNCDICKQRFGYKRNLNVHIKHKHSNTHEKDYKCSECPYQTNRKNHLKTHLDTHTGIKDFECYICKQRFTEKGSLKVHLRNQHSNTNEKDYECSECSYQTNYKSVLKRHLGTRSVVKDLQCDICKQRFTQKGSLKVHLRNQHSNTNEKDYKCSECSYQTNYKSALKRHLGTHSDVKDFQCDICKRRFGDKSNLQRHLKIIHSKTNEKEYK